MVFQVGTYLSNDLQMEISVALASCSNSPFSGAGQIFNGYFLFLTATLQDNMQLNYSYCLGRLPAITFQTLLPFPTSHMIACSVPRISETIEAYF